jgi:hypothetical protein
MAPGVSLARRVRRAGAAGCVFLPFAALGCDGEVVRLGSSGLLAGGAGGMAGVAAAHVWDVQSTPIFPQVKDVLLANPTLTEDGTQLFYSQQERFGDPEPRPQIMRAVRDGTGWGSIEEQTLGGPQMPEVSSPAISADGGELWVGMLNGTNTDIFKSELQAGAWTTPVRVAELCSSDYDDAPRQPALAGTLMPLSSKRHGGRLYQIYLSKRENENAVWSEPSQALLGAVSSAAFQSADGFLDRRGLELYFSSTRDGDHADSDLYVSRRASLDAAFGEPEPLTDLNDPVGRSEERMPWLSSDGKSLYFVSDRTGQYTLYLATKL